MSNYTDLFGLAGRDVWFFGGAGYLGSRAVLLAASAGAKILCIDLEEKAHRFVAENKLEGQVTPLTLDVSDIPAAEALVEEQISLRGVPAGLVMLTYASTGKAMEDLATEDFDRINHGGLTATFAIARKIGGRMAQNGGGSIVLFSSMYGTVSPKPDIYEAPMNPNPIEYGVGKAGIQQMARYMATHWGKSGVRCNSIAPGPFPFPSQQEAAPGFMDRLAASNPLGRIGQPEEMAGPVLFLLSDASSYVTGHNLAVDGGWTAW